MQRKRTWRLCGFARGSPLVIDARNHAFGVKWNTDWADGTDIHGFFGGIVEVMTASGARQSYTYSIAMTLANKVHFPSLRATEGNISGGDVLIGMDVISQGDFAVTNANGRTMYSF